MDGKDDRWPKQFGDFAECLAMYVLGQLKNMSVARIDHVGADLIAAKREDKRIRYAVSVKIRVFFMQLKDLKEMSEDRVICFLGSVADGIQFKYTEGKKVRHLSAVRECRRVDYTELAFSALDETVSFME